MHMNFEDILRQKIFESDSVYIDYWAILHFVFWYWMYAKFKLKPTTAILLIIGYEIIEPSFTFFRPETPIDMFWDIIMGIAGYYTAKNIMENKGG
jgi:hypothetical protein